MRRVVLASATRVALQQHTLVVIPQMPGVIRVRFPLAVVAIKPVEAHLQRITDRPGIAQAPFAERPGGVTGALQQVPHRARAFGHRRLPLGLVLVVTAHRHVPRVQASHQRRPRGRAHCAARIMLGETHPAGRQPVQMRRGDLRSAVGPHVSVAQIIGQDVNNVGRAFVIPHRPSILRRGTAKQRHAGQQPPQQHPSPASDQPRRRTHLPFQHLAFFH